MLKESVFFKFLNRRNNIEFNDYLDLFVEDLDYINWNDRLLPHDYGDAELEYLAIRENCALFDVSPLRKYQITGLGAGDFLDHLLTKPVSNAATMLGIYVAFCNDDGSLKDDAILYKYDNNDYLLMPSDIDHGVHFESLRLKLAINDVSIVDCTDLLAGMAIQGPSSATVLKNMGFQDVELLQPFQVKDYQITSGVIRVARMGFTADLGYECWFKVELSNNLEQLIRTASAIMGISIPGYGLTALEACRLEGGFIVAGWDCSTEADPNPGFERTPLDLGLGWLVNLNAADFVGRQALLNEKQQGSRFVLRSFAKTDASKADQGTDIWASIDGEDVQIGLVNCSSWSWGLEKMIGNASIYRQYMNTSEAWIFVEGKSQKLQLSRDPLLNLERRNLVPAPILD